MRRRIREDEAFKVVAERTRQRDVGCFAAEFWIGLFLNSLRWVLEAGRVVI